MIGFFDSGVGGITVLKEALSLMPGEDYIYYADTANIPYGTRSREDVSSCVNRAVEFIAGLGVDALVIACNTATSIAIEDLRCSYDFPILGMEPAVKPAIEKNSGKRILVAATPLTLKEEKFHDLLCRTDHSHIVDPMPAPELVTFAENFMFDKSVIVSYLKDKMKNLKIDEYGTVVLGCTHFPFFRDAFREVFSHGTSIIDGSGGTVRYLQNILTERGLLKGNGRGNIAFYSSGIKEEYDCRYRKYLNIIE